MRFVLYFSWAVLALTLSAPAALSDAGHGAPKPKMEGMSSDSHGAKKGEHAAMEHWSGPAIERDRVNPVQVTREGLFQAGELYRDNCVACHGGKGDGDGPLAKDLDTQPSNLFVMAPRHTDGDLRWKIATGRGEMPGWGDVFSSEQMWNLVHYLKTVPAFQLAQNPEEQSE